MLSGISESQQSHAIENPVNIYYSQFFSAVNTANESTIL
jgi:hypothetical protein